MPIPNPIHLVDYMINDWIAGEVITESKMDNIEIGIGDLNQEIRAVYRNDTTDALKQRFQDVESMAENSVHYDYVQNLTSEEKSRARENIGALAKPNAQGFEGQVLVSDGNGGQSWQTIVIEDHHDEEMTGAVRYDVNQNLTGAQKLIARNNIEAGSKIAIADILQGTTYNSSYPSGYYFWNEGRLYKTITNVISGNTISPNTNCIEVQIGTLLATLESQMADLLYEPISITSFTVSPNTAELGSTVTSVTFNYTLNKSASTLILDGTQITDSSLTGEISKSVNISSNKTWTLTTTDERMADSSKNATLSFLNKVYYGVSNLPETINSPFLLGLSNGTLTSGKSRTFSVTAGLGQYIWYAVPSRFGNCSFNVGGFDGGFIKTYIFSHTNSSGYSENYDVYRSDNAELGATTVKVS